jgi:hypothetical protein
MKEILITNAVGFLGSDLCDCFIKEDYFAIGMDYLKKSDLRNIEEFSKMADHTFHGTDTTKAQEILGWEAMVAGLEGMKITYNYLTSLTSVYLFKEEHKDFSKHIN